MKRDFAQALRNDLARRFERQYKRRTNDPSADLKLMREQLFDPVSREERLRRELERLREQLAWPPPRNTPEVLAMPIGGDAYVITPEGRLAITCLTEALASKRGNLIEIDELDISAAEHLLAETYRDWVRYRLGRVLTLQQGQGRAMLPAAIGTVLFLLLNGNIGDQRALTQPKDPREQELLDEAVTGPVQAFVEALGETRRRASADRRHWQLYNGYGLSEARRRMGKDIVLERDPDGGDAKRLYVAEDAEDRVIDALARELRVRAVDRTRAEAAFDRLMAAYEEQRPRIAAFGVTHARASRTRRLRTRLLDSL